MQELCLHSPGPVICTHLDGFPESKPQPEFVYYLKNALILCLYPVRMLIQDYPSAIVL